MHTTTRFHAPAAVRWSSGAIYSPRDMAAATSAEKRRLDGLLANASLPIVFFDVAIKGKPVGRIKMLLYTHISPLAAENMRALCTGEKGIAPAGHEGAGQPYHFKVPLFVYSCDGGRFRMISAALLQLT